MEIGEQAGKLLSLVRSVTII